MNHLASSSGSNLNSKSLWPLMLDAIEMVVHLSLNQILVFLCLFLTQIHMDNHYSSLN